MLEFDRDWQEKEHKRNNVVWICWFQGLENAPDIVKRCVGSIQTNLKGKEIILIDNNNITSTEINVSSSTNTNTTLQKDKRKRSLTPLKINRLLSGIDKSSMEMYKTANNLKILNTQI